MSLRVCKLKGREPFQEGTDEVEGIKLDMRMAASSRKSDLTPADVSQTVAEKVELAMVAAPVHFHAFPQNREIPKIVSIFR